jgi:hypothetical protein
MDGVRDAMIGIYQKAGLKTGCCVRYHAPHYVNGKWTQDVPGNALENYVAKIQYAKARFGDMIFYLDSAVLDPNFAATMRQLQKRFPDVLLIPEIPAYLQPANPVVWSASAPYMECAAAGVDSGSPCPTSALPAVVAAYPAAFSCYRPMTDENGNVTAEQQIRLNAAVKNGDILLAPVYWMTSCACVKTAYQSNK